MTEQEFQNIKDSIAVIISHFNEDQLKKLVVTSETGEIITFEKQLLRKYCNHSPIGNIEKIKILVANKLNEIKDNKEQTINVDSFKSCFKEKDTRVIESDEIEEQKNLVVEKPKIKHLESWTFKYWCQPDKRNLLWTCFALSWALGIWNLFYVVKNSATIFSNQPTRTVGMIIATFVLIIFFSCCVVKNFKNRKNNRIF